MVSADGIHQSGRPYGKIKMVAGQFLAVRTKTTGVGARGGGMMNLEEFKPERKLRWSCDDCDFELFSENRFSRDIAHSSSRLHTDLLKHNVITNVVYENKPNPLLQPFSWLEERQRYEGYE